MLGHLLKFVIGLIVGFAAAVALQSNRSPDAVDET